MTFDEYQKQALTTDSYGGSGEITSMGFITKILGLVGESGELAEKFKKIYRNNNGVMSPEEKDAVIRELGDILWYIGTISRYLNVSMEEVASTNIQKVLDRKERGAIKSAGDYR